jgi:hypothetical protein
VDEIIFVGLGFPKLLYESDGPFGNIVSLPRKNRSGRFDVASVPSLT